MRGSRARPRLRRPLLLLPFAALTLGWSAAPAPGQQAREAAADPPTDTVSVFDLDAVVVTARRSPARLATSAAAVSVLHGPELRDARTGSLARALERTPGLVFLDFDGAGGDPQPVVRGFYGGGEAEYVLLLLDGVPVTRLRDGRINWDLVPLAAAERVEVIRGGSSSLWGDQAIGGVINVVTRAEGAPPAARFSATIGELGTREGSAFGRGPVAGRTAIGWVSVGMTDGFRDHADRSAQTVGGSIALAEGAWGALNVSTLHHWRRFDVPGPVADAALDAMPRTGVLPFFRMDESDERTHRLGLDGSRALASAGRLSGYLVADVEDASAIVTHALAADFADTKSRDGDARRILGSLQLEGEAPAPAGLAGFVLGVDASAGRFTTTYRDVLSGGSAGYEEAFPAAPGDRVASGVGRRRSVAAFGRYELRPVPRVEVGVGARLDWLRDTFTPTLPADAEDADARHLALSPTLGVNVLALEGAAWDTRVYATVGRSFKAATPDQLFDQRPVPVPFPPFAITVSNPELEPQRGLNLEAGAYHRAELLPGRLLAEASLSAYRMELEDQLDFDLESFRYVNLGESLHRGVEAALRLMHPGGSQLSLGYTAQRAGDRSGEHEGRALKAIPGHHATATGTAVHSATGAALTLAVARTGTAWLDDANTHKLDAHTRVDGRVAVPFGRFRLSFEVRNLLDEEYDSTGHPDPAGSDVRFLHPAAGRVMRLGLTADW